MDIRELVTDVAEVVAVLLSRVMTMLAFSISVPAIIFPSLAVSPSLVKMMCCVHFIAFICNGIALSHEYAESNVLRVANLAMVSLFLLKLL